MLFLVASMVISAVRSPRFFPSVMMGLQVLASVRYVAAGSWAQAGYWAFAVGLTATVTFGMGAK